MRLAVISDIHGNIAALEAVLADIAQHGIDHIVNLGDICSGGLFPRETAERLIPLSLPTIKGNHERQLLCNKVLGLSDQYARNTLAKEHLAWLATLPSTLYWNEHILLVHGTPTSDTTYLLETITPEGVRTATTQEVMARLKGTKAEVILCGHTHIQRIMHLPNGTMVMNPGSVGLPAYDDDHPFPHVMESGSPHARYAILESEKGQWNVYFQKVAYDWHEAALHAERHNRSDLVMPLLKGCVA